mmetsp:Transcript_11047/g.19975  ORF Transcript_11047/g.19975 Transcript_11047/m.19975 type:complete len:257 (-) Transcript_11047:465-1235(-)
MNDDGIKVDDRSDAVDEEVIAEVCGDGNSSRDERVDVIEEQGSELDFESDPYLALKQEAFESNLSDIESMNLFQVVPDNGFGKPLLVVVGVRVNTYYASMHRVLLLFIRLMDEISRGEFCVLYFNSNVGWSNQPGFYFLSSNYYVLPRRYKVNLSTISVVHPGVWVRGMFGLLRPILSTKFWNKLHYADRIEELWLDDVCAEDAFDIPSEATQFELSIQREHQVQAALLKSSGVIELTAAEAITAKRTEPSSGSSA